MVEDPQKKRKKKDCCHPYQSSWSAQFVRCFLPFMLKQKENHNAWTWARTHTQHNTDTHGDPCINMSRNNDNQARIRLTAGGTSDHHVTHSTLSRMHSCVGTHTYTHTGSGNKHILHAYNRSRWGLFYTYMQDAPHLKHSSLCEQNPRGSVPVR
jgi:hypothetical protein